MKEVWAAIANFFNNEKVISFFKALAAYLIGYQNGQKNQKLKEAEHVAKQMEDRANDWADRPRSAGELASKLRAEAADDLKQSETNL